MQRIHIVAVGKLKEGYLREAVAEYSKRLSRFCDLDIAEVAERQTLEAEGRGILRAERGYVIALAVEGRQMSSPAFAARMKELSDAGKEVTFVIGSSCGLCEDVKKGADLLLSFSEMTFPHQLMRVVLCEQIYRAFMINAGAEYHK